MTNAEALRIYDEFFGKNCLTGIDSSALTDFEKEAIAEEIPAMLAAETLDDAFCEINHIEWMIEASRREIGSVIRAMRAKYDANGNAKI